MNGLPFFSIIVPTHNRPTQLADCLSALQRLNYPRSAFEVIVVDDGSRTSLAKIATAYPDMDVQLIVQPQAGPATARNTGAARARGNFLAFTDDDCCPHPDWLRGFQEVLEQQPNVMFGGATVNALKDNPFSTASQILIDFIYDYYNAIPDDAKFFTSNNFACPAGAFRLMGGFDTSFPLAAGEDRELCDRWRFQGGRLTYAPKAVVMHQHALSLRSFCRQHFNYGQAAFHFHTLRRSRDQLAVRREPWSFYYSLILSPRKYGQRAWLLPGLMFLSQLANALGYFYARINRNPSAAAKKNSAQR